MRHIIVAIAVIVVLFLTLPKVRPSLRFVFVAALVLRLLVLYLDAYQIVSIPFTGDDTENFHHFTLQRLEGADIKLTNYTVFLTWIYRVFLDDGRFMAQFVNVLLSYGTVYYAYRALSRLNIHQRALKAATIVVAFMPVMLFFSGVLLREAWCEFFIALSAYFMVAWYANGGSIRLFGAFGCVLLAMNMHAGCVGILIGYLLAVLKGRTENAKGCSFETVVSLAMITMVVVVVAMGSDMFLGKFSGELGSDESYLDKDLSFSEGGSSYLLWLEGKSTVVGLLFAPLRMFYLLFSPVPWEWRNLMDVLAFVLDSLLYILLIINILPPPTPTVFNLAACTQRTVLIRHTKTSLGSLCKPLPNRNGIIIPCCIG